MSSSASHHSSSEAALHSGVGTTQDGTKAHRSAIALVPRSDVGQVFAGRYLLISRLGAGGMGEVYAALDIDLNRKVALKRIRSITPQRHQIDKQASHVLLDEAKTQARIDHPNVTPIFDVGRHEDEIFLAMELVAGKDMRR